MNKPPLLLLATCLLLSWHAPATAKPGAECLGNRISKTFESGAVWKFCWKIENHEGLVLTQVHYQAPGNISRRVLGEASLSQIEATFDDGATDAYFISTAAGLGGNNITELTQTDCPSGNLRPFAGKNVLCTRTKKAGYLYKYTVQRQTEVFQISTFSQVGPRNYQTRWSFYENGTIEPAIGLSGILPAVGESSAQYGWPANITGDVATGFTDHYLWRLDFDLDEAHGNERIEEINSVPTVARFKKEKVIKTLQMETGKSLNPDYKTFWRIADGAIANPNIGNISYEIAPKQYDQSQANSNNRSWLEHDLFFTTYKACERHAVDNRTASCGRNVSAFASNSQNIVGQDIVVWYKQSRHYLPRSEDNNRIATRWNSFQLIPRDWHATNPF
ncbi:MAG: hypothetical protein ACPG51_15735 [Thiolinea sp.]